MVNLECVAEALKMNGYTNINVGQSIRFTHNNRTYSTSKLRNGIITITTNNQNEVQHISDLVKDIEKSYKKAVKIREERLRKEREEAERLRKEKIRLEQELEAMNDEAVASQDRVNQDVVKQLNQLNSDIANNQKDLAEAQRLMQEVEKSKQDFVQITTEEIVSKGETKGWTVAKNYVDSKRGVTRLQLRKKQLN
tara:strand:- start:44 stop:628 length:585 start_codon:yes stop_codon:yes gene_type:complete